MFWNKKEITQEAKPKKQKQERSTKPSTLKRDIQAVRNTSVMNFGFNANSGSNINFLILGDAANLLI